MTTTTDGILREDEDHNDGDTTDVIRMMTTHTATILMTRAITGSTADRHLQGDRRRPTESSKNLRPMMDPR